MFDAAGRKPVPVQAPVDSPPTPLRVRNRVWTDVARIFSTVCNPFLTSLALFVILAGRALERRDRLLGAALQQRVLHLDRADAVHLLALRDRPHLRSRHVDPRRARARLHRVRHLLRARHARSVADPRPGDHDRLDGRLRRQLADRAVDHALLEDLDARARHHRAAGRADRALRPAAAARSTC